MDNWSSLLSPLVSLAIALGGFIIMDRKVSLLLHKETVEADIDDTKTRRDAEIAEAARKDSQVNALIGVIEGLSGRLQGVAESMNKMVAEQHTEHDLEFDRISSSEKQARDQINLFHEQISALADNTMSIKQMGRNVEDLTGKLKQLDTDVRDADKTILERLKTQENGIEDIRKSIHLMVEKVMYGLASTATSSTPEI